MQAILLNRQWITVSIENLNSKFIFFSMFGESELTFQAKKEKKKKLLDEKTKEVQKK